jgi:hypothetical protein
MGFRGVKHRFVVSTPSSLQNELNNYLQVFDFPLAQTVVGLIAIIASGFGAQTDGFLH